MKTSRKTGLSLSNWGSPVNKLGIVMKGLQNFLIVLLVLFSFSNIYIYVLLSSYYYFSLVLWWNFAGKIVCKDEENFIFNTLHKNLPNVPFLSFPLCTGPSFLAHVQMFNRQRFYCNNLKQHADVHKSSQ